MVLHEKVTGRFFCKAPFDIVKRIESVWEHADAVAEGFVAFGAGIGAVIIDVAF